MAKKTTRRQNGFSYVEVLIAALILSVIFVPALSGFRQAGASSQYAQKLFEADTLACNLLTEASRLPLAQIGGIFDIADFSREYQQQTYDYVIRSYRISGGILEAHQVFATDVALTSDSGQVTLSNTGNLFVKSAAGGTTDTILVGGCEVTVVRPTPGNNYLISVDVYDKKGLLLKRMAKLCIENI